MLSQIKHFLKQHFALSVPEISTEEQWHIASIALFLEMTAMDDKGEAKERELILSLVQKHYAYQTSGLSLRQSSPKTKRRDAGRSDGTIPSGRSQNSRA